MTLDRVLDSIMQLPVEQQEMLVEIWHKRRIASRRQEIAQDAQASLVAFRAGQYKSQPLSEIIADLRESLEEKEDSG